jgi:hypothetical protein
MGLKKILLGIEAKELKYLHSKPYKLPGLWLYVPLPVSGIPDIFREATHGRTR